MVSPGEVEKLAGLMSFSTVSCVVLWPLAAELKCVSLALQAQVRMRGAGLGAKGSSYGVSTADSYKDAVRKAMFARFTEME